MPPRASAATPHTRLSAAERRDQLVTAAVDLFSRKGFNGTTTREIAAAAGVTEAIIFRHFRTKQELYSAIIDQRVKSPYAANWLIELRRLMDRDEDEAVFRAIIEAILCSHKTDAKFERLMLYAALEGNEIGLLYVKEVSSSFVEMFRKYVRRRQKEGHMLQVSADLALMSLVGMAKHYGLYKYVWGLEDQRVSDEEARETVVQIAMNGLCLQPGRSNVSKARKR